MLIGRQGNRIQLSLDAEGETFRTPAMEERLNQALSAHFGEPVRVDISVVNAAIETPARQQRAAADDRLQNARQSIESDPNVRAMRDIFGATVQPESVRPSD